MVTYLTRLHLISWTCFSSLLSECFCQTYTILKTNNNTYYIYNILIYIHSYIHTSPKPGHMPVVGNKLLGFIRTLRLQVISNWFFRPRRSHPRIHTPSNSQSLRKLDLACNGIRQAIWVEQWWIQQNYPVLSLLRLNNKQLLYKELYKDAYYWPT